MKYQIKLVKDLQIGDDVYMYSHTKDDVIIGIYLLGRIIEVCQPFDGMGLLNHGISQSFDLYNKNTKKVQRYTSFQEIPILVKSNE